jgi:NADH pyrophosphatase NudC (nudix superfamily)
MAEPAFVPKPGQTDYSKIRYAPVVNTVVTHGGRVLLVQRSPGMRLYPGCWNGISGFLDDNRSVEAKVTQELGEELGMAPADIISLQRGQMVVQEAPEYAKTWLVMPVLARVQTVEFNLDWEAQRAKWYTPDEALQLDLLPGFEPVLQQFIKML